MIAIKVAIFGYSQGREIHPIVVRYSSQMLGTFTPYDSFDFFLAKLAILHIVIKYIHN